MPSLSSFFAIRTEGSPLKAELAVPAGTQLSLEPCVLQITPQDELFGPHAAAFSRTSNGPAMLLGLTSVGRMPPERFFVEAHRLLKHAVRGHKGWALDVLRLWPTPLATLADELPDEPFADDLITAAFRPQGEHGLRAETVGLSKLAQRELSFAFLGPELIDDAAALCAHFADFVVEHGRPLGERAALQYGFDRIHLEPVDGGGQGPFRGWHPPLIQRLIPASRFAGTGVAQVLPVTRPGETATDLTQVLRRAHEQRQVLEAHGLEGESPHQDAYARSCACLGEEGVFEGVRLDPSGPKESGWTFTCAKKHPPSELGHAPLIQLVGRYPALLKYLALPAGSVVSLRPEGAKVQVPRPLPDHDDEFDSHG